jgi:diguanylate cyclase (GGDEF)-like protein/PAS domain S-box-containing protein
MPVFSGLRARLLWLVLLAVAPALALILYTAHQSSELAARRTVNEARLLVRLVAADYERLLANARELLGTLARLPEVRGRDAAACNALFTDIKSNYAHYANLGAIGPDGRVFCSAVPSAREVSASDRAYYQRALQARGFVVGDFQIGRITHQAVVVFAHPGYDASGKLQVTVFAALDLAWLNQFAAKAQLPAGSTVTLFDSQGVILNRYPDPEKWVGQSRKDAPLTGIILASRGEGTTETTGLDNVPRLYAFAPLLAGVPDSGVYLSVGIPREVAFAEIGRIAARTLGGLAVAAGLVLAAAWFGGNAFLLRRIRALTDTARRLGRGDLATRSALPHGRDELGELAHWFDEMAASLQARATEVTRTNAALRDSEERFRSLVETTSDWIWEVDARGVYTYASPKVEDLLGYTPEEVVGKTPFDFMPPLEAARIRQQFAEIAAAGRAFELLENVNLRKDGRRAVIETSGVPIFDHEGGLAGWRGIDRDITARKQAEEAMLESEAKLRTVSESTQDAILMIGEWGKITFWNKAAETMFGYGRDEALGRNLAELIVPAKLREAHNRGLKAFQRTGEGPVIGKVLELPSLRRDGSEFIAEHSISAVNLKGKWHAVGVVRDITERKRTEERLRFLACHDELTSLPNRALLLDRLRQGLIETTRHDRRVAAVCLDLRDFKNINDTLGHETGDRLLQAVAERLQTCVRPGDTVARLGDDKFGMMLADVSQNEDVARVMQKIREDFAQPLRVDGHETYVSMTFGISLYPSDGTDAETLLKNADIAMSRAHARDEDYQYYSADMTVSASERLVLENDLRHVLERNELCLYYQPQVSLASGAITGVEALIRWQHPAYGMISPEKFIPLAEQTGLILPIGEWVLRQACAQASAWQAAGWPLRMSVNLSARQFRLPGLDSLIRGILDETGLDPGRLDIELTESMIVHDPAAVAAILTSMEKLGVQISIDDFGTGYSSLSHLKRFPVDVLKIDQSFVRDCTTDADDAAIVRAIVIMAHALGIQTIAEGAETKEQLEFLRRNGCDAIQGYYFSRPVPAEEIARLLRDKRRLEL